MDSLAILFDTEFFTLITVIILTANTKLTPTTPFAVSAALIDKAKLTAKVTLMAIAKLKTIQSAPADLVFPSSFELLKPSRDFRLALPSLSKPFILPVISFFVKLFVFISRTKD